MNLKLEAVQRKLMYLQERRDAKEKEIRQTKAYVQDRILSLEQKRGTVKGFLRRRLLLERLNDINQQLQFDEGRYYHQKQLFDQEEEKLNYQINVISGIVQRNEEVELGMEYSIRMKQLELDKYVYGGLITINQSNIRYIKMELRYEIYLGEMDFESRVALNELTRQRERNIGEYQKGYDATCQEIKKMSEEYSAYRIISQLDGKKFQDENSGEARSLFRETDGARK